MKKKNLVIIIIAFLIIGMLLFFIIKKDKKIIVTLDTNGGTNVSNIEVKNDEVIKLPENPSKEGYIFSAWLDNDNNVITNGTKITENTTLKALWIDAKAETVNVSFSTNDKDSNNVIIEKDQPIILPLTPVKEGYIFGGWEDGNGQIVNNGIAITEDIQLKAIWFDKKARTKTITVDTTGGNNIGNIVIAEGTPIKLPTNPTRVGYVFVGWIDENGNSITESTILTDNITIKAVWKEPYTCPKDCTPIKDGSTCTKVTTTSLTNGTGCPSGYTLVNGHCIDKSKRYYADFIDEAPWSKCKNTSHYKYDECIDMGCEIWCAPETSKITVKKCPSGYTKDENTCKKTQTIKCKAN